MKHLTISFFSIAVSAALPLLSSCGDRLPQGEDILLSDWVGEPEFIALDSSDPEALIDGGEITVSDRYIGIYSPMEKPFKLFDRATGKFLRNIGNIGRGPGEYTGISFAQIDENGGKVWISTLNTNKIYSYDISTGRLSEDLPLAYEGNGNPNQGYNFMVDSKARTVTIAGVPYDDSGHAGQYHLGDSENRLRTGKCDAPSPHLSQRGRSLRHLPVVDEHPAGHPFHHTGQGTQPAADDEIGRNHRTVI